MSYISLTGKIVELIDNQPTIILDKSILSEFFDPIMFEQITHPVAISVGNMSNIYELSHIRNWFMSSNVEPLSGLKLTELEIKFIPCLNNFLLLLCLEEKENKLYFHSPFGDILNLLSLARVIFFDMESKIGFNAICMDLRKYISNKKNVTIYDKWIAIDDIIKICPVTKKQLFKNCLISKFGIYCHKSFCGFESTGSGGPLSDFGDMFDGCSHIDIRSLIEKLCSNYFEENTIATIKLFGYRNVANINYDQYDNTLEQLFLDEINYNTQRFYELNLKTPNIQHLEIRPHYLNAYKFYVANKNKITSQQIQKIQKFFDEEYVFGAFCGGAKNKLINIKQKYSIPSFSPFDNIYGDDYSMLTIGERILRKKGFKDCMFIGTTFNHVTFYECSFSDCMFIACCGNLFFDGCSFSYNCKFYLNDNLTMHAKDYTYKSNGYDPFA